MRRIGWRTVAGALLLGGVIHICAVLAVPLLGPGNAFLKLREALPANRAVLLPPPAPGKRRADPEQGGSEEHVDR